jgi:CheY-like chemotaxis protein
LARKILLADDSVTAQNMGRRILSDAGYEVTTVNNGSAALKKIAESKPDLIVLDVYMPGYGGLEVCQRLRESRETARIPILLTVGKLEPFKPEEARRVKADAFIVKPFEASELLTALTKLEDRIVPHPAPYKPGRFAQAISALDSENSNEYGDLESGWKHRLKIPVPQSHGPDVEIDEQEQAESKQRTEARVAPKAADAPALVPRDITSEEIAAINAAAAAFGTQIGEPVAEPERTIPNPPESASEPAAASEPSRADTIPDTGDEVAATFATAAPVEETASGSERDHTELKGDQAVEETRAEDSASVSNLTPETQPEAAVGAQEIVSAAPAEMLPKAEERDDFAAALESLGPANGQGVPQRLSGPRWTAELAAVTDAESALILEQEMQKAVAAMAAVQYDEAGQSATAAMAATPSQGEDAHQPAFEPLADAVHIGQQTDHEPPTSLVASMIQETALPTLSDLVDAVLPRPSTDETTPETQGAAFAAAASASSDAISQMLAPPEVSQGQDSSIDVEERQRESELAAAWESWKHIRESVVEPQLKSQVAGAAFDMAMPPAEQPSRPQPESGDETGAHEESVASIVDSVLADLKPKLMEEISRKIGKEKRRK